MSTPPSNLPPDQHGLLPGHGPTAPVSDPAGARADPGHDRTTGHDREVLGAELGEQTAALYGRVHEGGPPEQSEFRAFLDDLKLLVRSQRAQSQVQSPGEPDRRIDRVRGRMSDALGTAAQAGSVAGRRVRQGFDRSRTQMRQGLDRSREQVRHRFGQSRQRVQSGIGQSRRMVAAHPLEALVAAAAVGLVVGWLLTIERD